jgi:dTDP-4-dehydrorhamnose reductase
MQILLFDRNGQAGWELRIVEDRVGNPAWCPEATAEILTRLSKEEGSSLSVEMERYKGVYHFSSEGETSWCGFAKTIVEADPGRSRHRAHNILPMTPAEYPRAAKYPQYSVLSKVKIRRAFGLSIATWSEPLDDCLQALESHNEGNETF